MQVDKVLNAVVLPQIKIIDIFSLARRKSKNGQMHSVIGFYLNQYLYTADRVNSLIKKGINLNKSARFQISYAKFFDNHREIDAISFTNLGIKYSKINQIIKNIVLFDNINAFVAPLQTS